MVFCLRGAPSVTHYLRPCSVPPVCQAEFPASFCREEAVGLCPFPLSDPLGDCLYITEVHRQQDAKQQSWGGRCVTFTGQWGHADDTYGHNPAQSTGAATCSQCCAKSLRRHGASSLKTANDLTWERTASIFLQGLAHRGLWWWRRDEVETDVGVKLSC